MKSWFELPFWDSPAYATVQEKLDSAKLVLPPASIRFRALDTTSPDKTKVLILGQDPYFIPGMANGYAFSVPSSVHPRNFPPTLHNIVREYCTDLHHPRPRTGYLHQWALEGVLLLNVHLSVQAFRPLSHANFGWHGLTEEIVKYLSQSSRRIVYILWGHSAKHFEKFINQTETNHVISSPHPSPLSALRGFFGSRPFSRANAFLKDTPVNWRLE